MAALYPVVPSVYNRNEYQRQNLEMFLGRRARSMRKAVNPTAIRQPTV
jgi:hypothetical protein